MACLLAVGVQAGVVTVWTGNSTAALTALGVAGVVGFVLLTRSRERLLEPASRLTSRMQGIVSLGNFRDRVERPGQAELDSLADEFNRLLGKLEQHDRTVSDLKTQRDEQIEHQTTTFESEIEEHKRAMKELVLAKAAAEESSLAKSAFLFNMSHELRTPLNAIMGYSELLQEGAADDDPEQRAKDIAKILGAGRHLLTLINAVLDLSKIEAGRVELEIETIDIAQLLQDVVSTSESLAATQNNTLALEIPDDLGTMQSDATKIRQVLLNLLGNASKFTTNGAITVTAVRERELSDWVVIHVKDTGIGMSVEEQHGLFREFKQGRAAREQPERGTGLGLAISQALCQLLGGVISVVSTQGAGSVFTVRLPAAVKKAVDGRPRPARPVTPETENAAHTSVLVIDHDAGARELVRRVTARLGFRMIEASTASEGYRLAVVHEPLAIVLEVALSGQNGWSLLERLTNLPVVGKVPVIVVSVNDDKARSQSLGAIAHLMKPVPTQQLFTLLRDLASQRSGTQTATPAAAGVRTPVATA